MSMNNHPKLSAQCRYCQHDAPLLLRVGDVNRHITDEVFSYYRCPNCGLIFIDPIPAKLGDYYSGDYLVIPPTSERFDELAKDSP